MYISGISETHLNFGGMHIHIHAFWVHFQKENVHRLTLSVQYILIRRANGVGDDLVSNKALIHVSELMVSSRSRGLGQSNAAIDPDPPLFMIDGQRLV